jgi:2-hydroxychromene-2-carboxylate isomerase
MLRQLDYYFSLTSPWAYLGHRRLLDIAGRHHLEVIYKPVVLGNVFSETGGLVLAKRHPVRQHYRLIELQRWREKLGLSFHLKPRHWPFDATLADRFAIAVARSGTEAGAFLTRAMAAVWENQENLADGATLERLAIAEGLDGPALIEAARADVTAQAYEQNIRDALAGGVFGSPSYVLEGEVFWGQDRLELLDDALASGRPPFKAPA